MVDVLLSGLLFLPSPNTLGLPMLERGQRARSETREVVEEQWPAIEALVRAGQVAEGIAAMERLAKAMRERTGRDPEMWRETLTLSRRLLYDDMVSAARWGGKDNVAREALERCRRWDEEAREHIDNLLREQ